eukprot:c25185_g3_i1 orf=754-3909(-)
MDDFANILQRDYGLRPQGKSAPMSSVKPAAPSPFSSSSPSSTPASIHRTSSTGKLKNGSNRNSKNSASLLGESLDEDFFFGSSNGINSTSLGHNTFGSAAADMPVMYDDVFGGPPKFASPSYPPMPSSTTHQNSSSQSYDDIFRMPVKPSSSTSSSSNKASTFPVFDAPLYDEDIFGGVPGIRSGSVVYDDVFSGGSTVGTSPSVLEDLLGVPESRDRTSGSQQPAFDSSMPSAGIGEFDDLLPGFGGTEPAKPRPMGGGKFSPHNSSMPDRDSHGMSSSDPFDVLNVNEPFNVPQSAGTASASPFSDSDALKVPHQSSGSHRRRYSNSDYDENIDVSGNSSPHISTAQSPSRELRNASKSKSSSNSAQSYASVLEENHSKRNQSSSNQAEEQTRSSSSPKPQYTERAEAPSFHSPIRRTRQAYDDVESVRVPKVVENRQVDEFWISVEDVKLVTEPTAAPPPTRRPPLPGSKHGHTTRKAAGSKAESSFKDSASRHESPQSAKLSSSRGASEHSNRPNFNNTGNVYDELEEFASGVSRARKETKMDMSAATLEEEIMEGSAAVSASAMAMKEAMERARSKLRDRVMEEKESGLRAEEAQEGLNDAKEDEEEKARESEEKERLREREEREAKALREREEREKRRREREKEKEREREREREKDRIAVERATQEARERAERAAVERATAEARERAAAEARQRAAVERVTAEARERAAAEARERVAVERATAEARERAAAEARERAAAERAAAEARERAAAEAREKAVAERAASEARTRVERSFVERVNAEARERAAERAAAEARERAERAAAERASAAAREQQRRSENDLEAFFASSSRPGSAPRQRSPAKGTSSDGRQPNKGFSTEGLQRNAAAAPGVRKVAPTSSTDDWTSLFGPAVSAAGEFQEIEGESAERRKARWDRQQRTAERAAKALDEKNQRDLQSQREQAERHRAGDMLDAEIKRWAAGKEGNLRALLSTLQYVLWPECGWQAVSLTDLITAAAVKKVYRKATLCVHPDKVQQKGATIQQKYIAEKVFDLLKEAWNKFNSEELF